MIKLEQKGNILIIICILALAYFFSYYEIQIRPKSFSVPKVNEEIKKPNNPVQYFEIPVINLERASSFYKRVFHFEFTQEIIDNNQMALFPFYESSKGITGALAKGNTYIPSKQGTLVYFDVENIDKILSMLKKEQILYPKTKVEGKGFVAEIEDSEGNKIGLFSLY